MGAKGPEPFSTDELFRGKKVVLFSVPGAFTPTCSAKHLPGFVKNADEAQSQRRRHDRLHGRQRRVRHEGLGRDGKATGKVEMLADGNGEYARALGLELDASKFGMGTRSKRFSVIVDDGVVEDDQHRAARRVRRELRGEGAEAALG